MERLAQNPYSYNFHWAMRLLSAAHSGRPKPGTALHAREDWLRILQFPYLEFAGSTIREFEEGKDGKPDKLTVNFLGMFGPNGPLPLNMTDYALDRMRASDHTLVNFINIFHSRLISLFHRSWEVHQKAVDLDLPDDPLNPEFRRFSFFMASLIGLGMPTLRNRDALNDEAKFYFSGHLACHSKHPEGLASMIGEYFGIDVTLQDFSGEWLTIPEDDVCKLGDSIETGVLGASVIIGSRIWQCQTKFRIKLGPLRLSDLVRLLPSHDSYTRMNTWVFNYTGFELAWDIQYILLADEVPSTRLGDGAFLGWTTWINTSKPTENAEDLIINPDITQLINHTTTYGRN